jgi:hypothetical protein
VTDATAQDESRRIREWLLAILRFAVTLEPSDRAAVLAIAAEMDRLGCPRETASFAFFVRTSRDFCGNIAGQDGPERTAALRSYLAAIEDIRLRRAIEAALELDQPSTDSLREKTKRPPSQKRMYGSRRWYGDDLWQGLQMPAK